MKEFLYRCNRITHVISPVIFEEMYSSIPAEIPSCSPLEIPPGLISEIGSRIPPGNPTGKSSEVPPGIPPGTYKKLLFQIRWGIFASSLEDSLESH